MTPEAPPRQESDLRWLVPDWPAATPVRAFTTTRTGGYSRTPYAGFNLGFGVGDQVAAVRANRALLGIVLGLPAQPLWLRQVHGNRVVHAASGVARAARADACVACAANQVCVVLSADCLPILLCDRAATRIAAAHAGWRGLVAGVLEATVAALATRPAELLAWIGPGIGRDAYQVGNEVRETFLDRDPTDTVAFTKNDHGAWQCDLAALARRRLLRLGIPVVRGGEWCTGSDPARFYSYRRDGVTGRMATLIWIDRDFQGFTGSRFKVGER